MTIINSQAELDEMIEQAELDIKLWRTHTFREVYEHIYWWKKIVTKDVCIK